MSDQEARADARGRTPKPNLREEALGIGKKRAPEPPAVEAYSERVQEAREGVEAVSEHKPQSKATPAQPLPAPDTSRLQPAAKASYGRPGVARAVIGDDNRFPIADTTEYPYSAIAHLRMTFGDDSLWNGTAWFIGPHTLMTAGHNVWSRDPNDTHFGWATRVEVMPGRNGAALPFGWFTASRWDAPGEYKQAFGDQNYDYGVLVINEPLGNTVDWFGFEVLSDDALFETTANVCGYPWDKPDGTMWCDAKQVSDIDSMNVYDRTDTEQEESGAPVFYQHENGRSYAVAIHNFSATSANSGRRITNDVFAWMKAWKYDPFG